MHRTNLSNRTANQYQESIAPEYYHSRENKQMKTMARTSIKSRKEHCFTSTGGLLFFAAALSTILAPQNGNTHIHHHSVVPIMSAMAWSPSYSGLNGYGLGSRSLAKNPALSEFYPHQPSLGWGASASTMMAWTTQSSSSFSALHMSSSDEAPQPLATEGDWSAYLDETVTPSKVYYFNHNTGESLWEPPTPTFPDKFLADLSSSSSPSPNSGGDGGGGQAVMSEPSSSTPNNESGRTLYEILGVPPTASRSDIKRAYLELAKEFHPDAIAKRGGDPSETNEFNEIARAWMILSEDDLRRKYDSEVGLLFDGEQEGEGEDDASFFPAASNNNATSTTNTTTFGTASPPPPPRSTAATITTPPPSRNKFEKNPVLKVKKEIASAEGDLFSRNKFEKNPVLKAKKEISKVTSSSNPMFPPPPPPPPLRKPMGEVEVEEEGRNVAGQQASMETERGAWPDAIQVDKPSEEDIPLNTNTFSNKGPSKTQRTTSNIREKERMNRLQGMGGVGGMMGGPPPVENTTNAVPQQGGGVNEDQVKFEKEFQNSLQNNLQQQQQQQQQGTMSEPKPMYDGDQQQRTTSNIREKQRMDSLQNMGGGFGGGGGGGGGMMGNAPDGSTPDLQRGMMQSMGGGGGGNNMMGQASGPPVGGNTPDLQQVTNELKQMYEAEMERLKNEMIEKANATQAEQLRQMEESHRAELQRVQSEMEAAMSKKMESEMNMLSQKHANEMNQMKKDAEAQSAMELSRVKTVANQEREAEVKKAMTTLKEKHAADIAKLQANMSSSANSSQAEQMRQLNASHQKELQHVKNDAKALAARELDEHIKKIAQTHAYQIEGLRKELTIKYDAKIDRIQKEANDRLGKELERGIQLLKNEHSKEINNLRRELAAASSAEDQMKKMSVSHEADMKRLRASLEINAARNLEAETKKLSDSHSAEMAKLQKEMMASSEERIKRIQTEAESRRADDVEKATQSLNRSHAADMERLKAENSKQAAAMKAAQSDEIKRLATATETLKEEHVKNLTSEIQKLKRDLESKDGEIESLQLDLQERDEDVSILVPEVARLQELNNALQQTNENLNTQPASVQSKNDELVAKLERDLQAKNNKIADLEAKVNSISAANNGATPEFGSSKELQSSVRNNVSGNRDQSGQSTGTMKQSPAATVSPAGASPNVIGEFGGSSRRLGRN